MKKQFKRFTRLIFIMTAALLFTACGGSGVSEYYAVSAVEVGSTTYRGELLDDIGYDGAYIDFTSEDGGYFRIDSAEQPFLYRDGVFTSSGFTVDCEKDDRQVVFLVNGNKIIFEKAEKPADMDRARKELADNFPGLYILNAVKIDDNVYKEEELFKMGLTRYSITVEDKDNAIIDWDGRLNNCTIENGRFVSGNSRLPFVYQTDKITVDINGMTALFVRGERDDMVIPVGYYELTGLRKDNKDYDATGFDNFSLEMGEDGTATIIVNNVIEPVVLEGTNLVSNINGTSYKVGYRQQTIYLWIEDNLFYLKRAEKSARNVTAPAGTYVLNNVAEDGEVIPAEELEGSGMEISTVTVSEDGRVTLYLLDETIPLEYNNGKYYIDGEDCGFTVVDDGSIYLRIYGFDMVYIPE